MFCVMTILLVVSLDSEFIWKSIFKVLCAFSVTSDSPIMSDPVVTRHTPITDAYKTTESNLQRPTPTGRYRAL